ncbi:AraC family transcriptional regulator [Eubacteriales bacterium OttesenSCG-928-A19]|nr:AraC family transcriptional regulator [Eubacteriales bacterium OttesenSCG-928-A19]
MLRRIEVGTDLRERFESRDITFPLDVWTDDFSQFVDCTVNCHWHHELEYGYVLSGTVEYFINDTPLVLRQGDAVFVNSDALHMGRQARACEHAAMFTVTFPPALLAPNINGTVHSKYFLPLMGKHIEGFRIAPECPAGQRMIALLNELYALDDTAFGYELECLGHASALWLATLQHFTEREGTLVQSPGSSLHAERAKEILSYIHAHYAEKITMDDIARHVSISRSECFRCFKRFMNKKPVEYINEYRLSKAVRLLCGTGKSITEICAECGFVSASYFSKLFRQLYGLTPLQYRGTRDARAEGTPG